MELFDYDDDECDLKLFDSYEPCMLKINKAIQLMLNMRELGYIDFDSEIQTLQFTNPGLKYIRNHGDSIKYYIQKYNLTLDSFGPMVGYMAKMFDQMNEHKFMNLSAYPTLETTYKINELGEIVEDMNEIVFSEKAPGEQME